MITAIQIERIVQTGAAHVLYREDGKWYHHLKKFPGALFDKTGMLYFETKEEYENNQLLRHNKDLNVAIGISNIPGYEYFNEIIQQKVNRLSDQHILNEGEAWAIFLEIAEKYESENEIFVSPSEHSRYQIISTKNSIVKIKRLDVPNSWETIGPDKFRTCIKRINNKTFPIPKGSIYEHVVEEATIVELLPMLDWNEKGNKIIYVKYSPEEENETEISEAKNDDINKKQLVSLKVRRGQKKLREKLFYLYRGKCAISNCDIKDVLHACHIIGFATSGINMSSNAILLRSDLHDLFDANLLAINPITKKIVIHSSLNHSTYFDFNGSTLKERIDKRDIDLHALNQRWGIFRKKK